jgi:hypothetical protein
MEKLSSCTVLLHVTKSMEVYRLHKRNGFLPLGFHLLLHFVFPALQGATSIKFMNVEKEST